MDFDCSFDDLLAWACHSGVGEIALAIAQEGVDATYLWTRLNRREIDGWGGAGAQAMARELQSRFRPHLATEAPVEFHESANHAGRHVRIRGTTALIDGTRLIRLQLSSAAPAAELPMNAKERGRWVRQLAEIRALDEAAAAGLGGGSAPRL